jgi:pyridoxamine 5'-phosphate oxidase
VVPDRGWLERRVVDAERRLEEGQALDRPPTWGGYRVVPAMYEFWQGRPDRLHDRLRYRFQDAGWIRERLAP